MNTRALVADVEAVFAPDGPLASRIAGYRMRPQQVEMALRIADGRPSVLIATHVPNAAVLEPNKARDQMIEKEILARFSKKDGEAAIAGYEKYRQFLDESLWTEMKMVT